MKSCLHLTPDSHITDNIKTFMEENFDQMHHDVVRASSISILGLGRRLDNYDIVVIHGLFSRYLTIALLLVSFRGNLAWAIWGADLYEDIIKPNIKRRLFYPIKELFFKYRLNTVITYIDADFEAFCENYSFNGDFKRCLLYKSNCIESTQSHKISTNNKNKLMIGGAATPENNHLEILDLVHKNNSLNKFTLFVPLSYGDSNYADEVKLYIEKNFGSHIVLSHLMPMEDYKKTLSSVRIGIFDQPYQMNMGTLISLVSSGALLYLPEESSSFKFFSKNGFYVRKLADLESFSDSDLVLYKLNENIQRACAYFTYDNLVRQYSDLFGYQKEG